MIKRLFDILFSFLGFIVLLPLILLISILIKKEDGGPVFYRGVRVGRFGRLFRIYKFRTMVMNAEKIGGPSTADDDQRLLKIGRFLRKYKLDEIPQLINVLKGNMSFVGPRPEVPSEVETYTEEEKKVLLVRPGITDWASLTYHNEGEILRGSKDPHQAYREKIKPGKLKLQLKYVDERSLFTDIKIILQTFITLLKTRT
ncbi:MAG: sugar transferase [Candidatus Edwardsbacteria bacterium]